MQSDRRRAQQMDRDSADPALHTDTAMIGADDFGLAGRIDSTHGFAALCVLVGDLGCNGDSRAT
jgi:hypothetical protein